MSKPIETVRVGLEHLGELVPLFDAYRGFYHQASDRAAAASYLSERLACDECAAFMARDGGAASGFTLMYPLYSSVSMQRVWLLNDLYVSPEHRRRGVARALMTRAAEFARSTGAGRIMLRTENVNTQAQALYAAIGYVKDEKFWTYNLKL